MKKQTLLAQHFLTFKNFQLLRNNCILITTTEPLLQYLLIAGLYSRGVWVPQATKFCLWVTGKTYFFHICVSLSAGHPGFHG